MISKHHTLTADLAPADDEAGAVTSSLLLDRRRVIASSAAAAILFGASFGAARARVGVPSFRTASRVASQTESLGQLQVVRGGRAADDGDPVPSQDLRLMLTGGNNADYSPVAFRQDYQIMASYLDPLVRIDEATMEPRPWLAEGWEVSEDGREITYALRGDVRWHDGEKLTAADVVFSFIVYRDDVDSAVRNLFVNLESVEELDDRTVRVRLTSPDGNWFLNASSQLIFNSEQYAKHWNAKPEGERSLSGFNWRKIVPIGSGPWQFSKRRSNRIEFTPHEGYWAGQPNFERMTLFWNEDFAARLAAWKAGEIDLLWPVSPADAAAAAEAPGRLYIAHAASVMFAAFNFDNPTRGRSDLLSDVNVRRALSLALDRERYAAEVFGGFIDASAAGTVAQPWAHDGTLTNPARDVTTARDLLKQAGWEDRDIDGVAEDEDGNRLALQVIVRNDARPELLSVLDSIVPDLAEAGVELEVRKLAPDRFLTAWIEERDYDLIAYAYNLYPGFTDFDLYGSAWDIRVNPQGWNPGGYQNDDVDAAIKDILNARDLETQREALVRLQRATNDDLFGLWFGFPRDLILVRPDLRGFQPNVNWQTHDTRLLWRDPSTASSSATPST